MAEAPGSDIGPYRIVAPIGSGGFATVYLARDHRLDSDVAIKILAENHSLDPDIRERFLLEAQLLRRLDSPHLVTVLDIGETARFQPYLVLQYANRGSLETRVRERGSAGWRASTVDVLAVARSLAAGLRAVHELDIVHRDVSPGNVLLTRTATRRRRQSDLIGDDERLLLADLGHAKDLAHHSGLTVGGGTPRFAAPEQRDGISRVDPRADVYAASALVAWLQLGDAWRSTETTSSTPDGVDAELWGAIALGLHPKPDDRPGDIDEWCENLRLAVQAPATAPAEDPTGVVDHVAPAPPSNRRRWLAPLAAAFVVAVGGGVAAGRFIDPGDPGDGGGGGGGRQDVVELDDGRVRVSDESGEVAAALFAPQETVAGQPTTLEAGATGAVDFVWILPDGALVDGTDTIEFTPMPGPQDIRLIVTGADGTTVELVVTLQAEEGP